MNQAAFDESITKLELDRDIVDALVSSGLHISPVLFDVKRTPDTIADSSFCVELQTRAVGPIRRQEIEEAVQDCTIRLLHRIPPFDQHGVKRLAYNDEELVLQALYKVTNFPKCRVLHTSTQHSIVNEYSFIVTEIKFEIRHLQPIQEQ